MRSLQSSAVVLVRARAGDEAAVRLGEQPRLPEPELLLFLLTVAVLIMQQVCPRERGAEEGGTRVHTDLLCQAAGCAARGAYDQQEVTLLDRHSYGGVTLRILIQPACTRDNAARIH